MPSPPHGRRELSWGLFGVNMGCGFFSLLLRSKCGASWSAPLVHPRTQWLGAAAGADCAWLKVRHGGFWKNFLSTCPLTRYLHLETWTSPLPSCIFQSFGCLGVALEYVVLSGRVLCLVQQWIHVLREAFGELHNFLRVVNSDPRRLLSIPQNGEVCTVDARVAVSLRAVRTLNLDIISTSSPCDGVW